MGGIVKAVGGLLTGPKEIKPQIADKSLFDISDEVKPAQQQYQPLLQASQANQQAVAPLQTQALQQLGMAATGQGPSLAEVQMKAAQDRNLAQQLAAVQAQRGGNAALNQRALLQNMSTSGRDIAQGAATARLQERDQFLNQANVANQNLRTDIAGAENLALQPKQSLQSWEMARVGAVNQAQAQNAQAQNQMTGALLGGAASIGAAYAGKKDGGPIKGPGTGTSDSIPIKASNGEFIVKAAIVKQPGMQKLLSQVNSGKIDSKQLAKILSKKKA